LDSGGGNNKESECLAFYSIVSSEGKSLPNEFDRLGIQNVALINSFFIGTASGASLRQDEGLNPKPNKILNRGLGNLIC